MVLAAEDEILIDDGAGSRRTLCRVEPDLGETRLNDGKCDGRGRLWIGTYARSGAAVGALYRLGANGGPTRMLDHVRASNGLAWNAANDRLYFTDTPTRRIDVFAFDLDAGELADRRPYVTFAPDDGLPDGIAADAEGGVWVAMFGGRSIRRYSDDGRLDAVVEMPVPHPTSVAFGGRDLDVLYVTSSRHRLTPAEVSRYPLAGALFAIDPGVRGAPVAAFIRRS